MKQTDPARFENRRAQLVRMLRSLHLDAVLVTCPVNVSYLTGFSGDDSYVLVGIGFAVLCSDTRFTEQIEEECPGLDMSIRRTGEYMPERVGKLLKRAKLNRVGFESEAVTVAGLERLKAKSSKVEWVSTAGRVEELRAIKDADEIRQIREAIRFAESAFGSFRAGLESGRSEKSLADALEFELRAAGATKSAFPSIVAAGPRGALPHAVPTERAWTAEQTLLVDWGAKGDFYHSDLTRVLVPRKISPKLERVYDVVARAQQSAFEAIRPGATGDEIDSAARKVIADAGFGRQFGHGTGHGLGLEVHEAPRLGRKSKDVLKPGMVVTIEPGIYLKGWGGVRIEDDVLVTKNGGEVLSSLPKGLGA